MAQAFITRRKGGGGVNKDLPAQITAFTATADSTPSVTLTWTNPTEYWAGTLIVKKAGSAPEGVNDGEKVYKGEGTSYTDFDVSFDTEYFYRAFPFNTKKQYQTLYAVASAKPVEGIALSSMTEGALVNIIEDGVAVPFYLACHDYESGLNGAGRQFMLRKDIYKKGKFGSNYNVYANGPMDTEFNGDYKAKFSEAVQTMMGETTFYYTPGNTNYTVTTLTRPIFTPSATEYGFTDSKANVEGSAIPIAKANRISTFEGKDYAHNTRSPYVNERSNQLVVTATGALGFSYAGGNETTWAGYRPAFTLPATALVNPTPNADGSYTLIE